MRHKHCMRITHSGALAINGAAYVRYLDDTSCYEDEDLEDYKCCVRSLYYMTRERNRQRLGVIYALLPFVNMRYGVLCRDAFETDVDKVYPLSFKDICGMTDRHNDVMTAE